MCVTARMYYSWSRHCCVCSKLRISRPIMQPISQRFDAALTEAARRQLESFVTANPGTKLAVLTSGDGFEIAAHPSGLSSVQRLAAMSSSLQALSEAMVQESGLTRIRNLI